MSASVRKTSIFSRKMTGFVSMILALASVVPRWASGSALAERENEMLSIRYRVVDVGTLGGDSSSASDINRTGQITGYSGTMNTEHFDHAFQWHGAIQDLGVLDAKKSIARRINENGEIAGYLQYGNSLSPTSAFVYKSGRMTKLPVLPGGQSSEANGINNKGWVVGLSGQADQAPCGVLWHGGAVHKIDNGIGGAGSEAQAINNHDDIAGVADVRSGKGHAFLIHQGKMRDLGTLGGDQSYAWSLTMRGKSWVTPKRYRSAGTLFSGDRIVLSTSVP